MTIATSITKRERKRVLTSGLVVVHSRYVLNFRDPRTGKRRQLFCRSQKEAIAKRDNLLAAIATDTYAQSRSALTVTGAIEHWLDNRRPEVKASTWTTYRLISTNLIVGPLLVGTSAERKWYREKGVRPEGSRFVSMLGPTRIADLTTGEIRRWHRTLAADVGSRSAHMAKTLLRAALSLAAEDYGIRPPPMPTKLGRGRPRAKRAILTPAQVGLLLQKARADKKRGIFIAWPYLVGTRPSEQLAVMWSDIDFERNLVRINRMQERSGELVEMTKTAAGTREVPLAPMLREMLLEWRSICPRDHGELKRVFPSPRGGALTYFNFRARVYKPALLSAGVPYTPPHAARHAFISTLQLTGTEVGVVAALVGHASVAMTLYYTRAQRRGASAVQALEEAYTGPRGTMPQWRCRCIVYILLHRRSGEELVGRGERLEWTDCSSAVFLLEVEAREKVDCVKFGFAETIDTGRVSRGSSETIRDQVLAISRDGGGQRPRRGGSRLDV